METEEKNRVEERNVLEAILFMSPRPLTLFEISKLSGIGSIGYIKELLEDLKQKFSSEDSAIEILNFGDSWQMSVKSKYLDKVKSITKSELSKGATKVLAYVYQNQPVLQSEIVKLLGSGVYEYVKELLKKGFIEATKKGRTKELKTTQKFKQYFEL
ncbi:MAG: SMC-Scp complex subunit ScpB [Candidatus Micrarchaeia archaeon]|jgi:segregation and condensation protein B